MPRTGALGPLGVATTLDVATDPELDYQFSLCTFNTFTSKESCFEPSSVAQVPVSLPCASACRPLLIY
jgi:hypothetical protein